MSTAGTMGVGADNHGNMSATIDRRGLLRSGTAFAGTAAALTLAGCGGDGQPTVAPLPTSTDPTALDLLNLTLNLKYLEAQFFSFAVFGTGLQIDQQGRFGAKGATTGGRRIAFTDPMLGEQAADIALDKIGQVAFLQDALFPSPQSDPQFNSSVSIPSIDIGVGPSGAFGRMAIAAGLSGAAGFDPYARDADFVLAAFFVTDLAVALGKYNAGIVKEAAYLGAIGAILGGDGYHAGTVRQLVARLEGSGTGIVADANRLSDFRDRLDGGTDDDSGLGPVPGGFRLVATDQNGLPYARPPVRLLNILFQNAETATSGGFFPTGISGNLRASGNGP